MRNLLGRLHARTTDEILRIARLWHIPLIGDDLGRHVGTLYRIMTDLRASRMAWHEQPETAQRVIRLLTSSDARPRTLAEIATALEIPEEEVREACVGLFRWGILGREGDTQELRVGQSPKVFVPRELVQDFRRVIDEIDAGDQSTASLKTLLEVRDDPDIEDAARHWGINVVPGMQRRRDLIADILRQVNSARRIDDVIAGLSGTTRTLWEVIRADAEQGPVPFDDAIERAGLTVPDAPDGVAIARGAQLRDVLRELENSLLAHHTYLPDGTRAFFVPREILVPGTVPVVRPLRTLQPLAPETVQEPRAYHPYAIAWDLLTVIREIANRGAPVWTPGEPLSTTWQRQVNGRLWMRGEDVPPEGYLSLLLYLGMGVGVLVPGPHPTGSGVDRSAIRPIQSPTVKQWRGQTFQQQIGALRDVWLYADLWIEGRELETIDVWHAEWQNFRRKLLSALRDIDTQEWLMVADVARHLAELDSSMVGTTFTTALATPVSRGRDSRIASVAKIIETELITAMAWFGFVELSRVPGKGRAMRVTEMASYAAADSRATPEPPPPPDGPTLTVAHTGRVTLHKPTPVHIWSLMAFADAEAPTADPAYQLSFQSVGRALGAGFDLEQITSYLTRQSGTDLPDPLETHLREWAVGYKRIRLRRTVLLMPDTRANLTDLKTMLLDKGYEIVGEHDGGVIVLLPITNDPAAAEEALMTALRATGFAGQWMREPD